MESDRSVYISTATTTVVVPSGPCTLKKVIITETAAGTISIYDNATGGTSNPIAVFKASVVENSYEFEVACANGLQVVTAGASKVTIVYSR